MFEFLLIWRSTLFIIILVIRSLIHSLLQTPVHLSSAHTKDKHL